MTGRIRISDHAILRYLERVEGVDVEIVRHRLERLAKVATDCPLEDACGVRFDGFCLVIRDRVAASVEAVHMKKLRRSRK